MRERERENVLIGILLVFYFNFFSGRYPLQSSRPLRPFFAYLMPCMRWPSRFLTGMEMDIFHAVSILVVAMHCEILRVPWKCNITPKKLLL